MTGVQTCALPILQWDKQQLINATVVSGITQTCRLRAKRPVRVVLNGKYIPARKVEKNVYVFKVIAGRKYKII